MNEVTTISLDLAKTVFCLFGLISRLCASHWTTVSARWPPAICTPLPIFRGAQKIDWGNGLRGDGSRDPPPPPLPPGA